MAPARGGQAALYYERTGDGPPVLLVMGLGMDASGWWRTVPVLAERLEVLTFDHRGIGRSSPLPGATSTAQMADEAVAVLDHAGVERAHVYGLSLGGMVAQQLALRHPGRVRSLTLGATHAGGAGHVRADAETQRFFRRRSRLPPEEAVWGSVPYNYGERTRRLHADRIGEDVAARLRRPPRGRAYRAQIAAVLAHDVHARLADIRCPTLVVHGAEDRMVPAANAERLSAGIPGAELHVVAQAGHLYATCEPATETRVADFMAAA